MPESDGLLRHIQHAEEWLRWARSDHRRGDDRAVVLRLLLAEAEIRHAREVGTHRAAVPHASRRPGHHRVALVGAAVALVLAFAAYVSLRPGGRYGPLAAGPSANVWTTTEPPAPAGAVQLEAGHLLTLGPPFADGDQGGPEGLSGRSEYRLRLVPGAGGAAPPARRDLTYIDGPVSLTISGDLKSSSAAF